MTQMPNTRGLRVEAKTRAQVRAAADNARRAFGYPGRPDLVQIVEHRLFEFGVTVDIVPDYMVGDTLAVTFPETDEIWIREDVYTALLRDDEQARFTVAHELGHLWMHEVSTSALKRTSPSNHNRSEDTEWQADAFANEFLMPAAVVQISCKTALDISRIFKVPFQTALRRYKELQMEGLIRR